MKRLASILLVLLFLQSKIGMAFNVHYCGGHIAKISWSFDAIGCGMEKSKASPTSPVQLQQKTCCNDDLIIAQNDSDQTTTLGQYELIVNQPIVAAVSNSKLVFPQRISFQRTPDPPVINALYKRNCTLVFYE